MYKKWLDWLNFKHCFASAPEDESCYANKYFIDKYLANIFMNYYCHIISRKTLFDQNVFNMSYLYNLLAPKILPFITYSELAPDHISRWMVWLYSHMNRSRTTFSMVPASREENETCARRNQIASQKSQTVIIMILSPCQVNAATQLNRTSCCVANRAEQESM